MTPVTPRRLLLAALILLIAAVAYPFWPAILIGLSFAAASGPSLQSLQAALEHWADLSEDRARRVAIGIILAGWSLALLLPPVLVGVAIAPVLAHLLTAPPSSGDILRALEQTPWLGQLASSHATQIGEWLAAHPVSRIAQQGLSGLGSIGGHGADLLLQTVVALFVLRIALLRSRRLSSTLTPLLAGWLGESDGLRVQQVVVTALRSTILGIVSLAIWDGLGIGVLAAFVGLPSPILWGVALALLSVLPAGTTVAVLAGFAVLSAQHALAAGAIFLVVGYLWVLIGDFFVKPKVTASKTHAPFVWILLAILGGVHTFGLPGLVIGPAAMLVAIDLLAGEGDSSTGRERP
jgi:predicted PurR-regulated permease PerM